MWVIRTVEQIYDEKSMIAYILYFIFFLSHDDNQVSRMYQYSQLRIIEDKTGGIRAGCGKVRNTHSVLLGKTYVERKRQLGRPRPRWENNIKRSLKK